MLGISTGSSEGTVEALERSGAPSVEALVVIAKVIELSRSLGGDQLSHPWHIRCQGRADVRFMLLTHTPDPAPRTQKRAPFATAPNL